MGEGDLVCKKGKFYLCQSREFPQDKITEEPCYIKGDFGLSFKVVTPLGIRHSAERTTPAETIRTVR